MTAQEYLEQAQLLDRQIDSKMMQLSRLRDLSTKTTGVMSDDVVSHTRNVHSLEDIMAAIMDMENEIRADIQRAFDLKKEIADTIGKIDNTNERLVLEYRYLCNLPWREIAERIVCTVDNAYKLHTKALKKIDLLLESVQQITVPSTCLRPSLCDMVHSAK